jgi:hypothetical protein
MITCKEALCLVLSGTDRYEPLRLASVRRQGRVNLRSHAWLAEQLGAKARSETNRLIANVERQKPTVGPERLNAIEIRESGEEAASVASSASASSLGPWTRRAAWRRLAPPLKQVE